ncbi:hypothetical protein CTB58_003707 [Vibrio mimicus]
MDLVDSNLKLYLKKIILSLIIFPFVFSFCFYIGGRTYGDIYFFFHEEVDGDDRTSNLFAMIDIDKALINNKYVAEHLFPKQMNIKFDILRAPDGARLSYMIRLRDIDEDRFEVVRNNLLETFYSYFYIYKLMCEKKHITVGCAEAYSEINNLDLYLDVTAYQFHNIEFKSIVKILLFSFFTTLCCQSLFFRRDMRWS